MDRSCREDIATDDMDIRTKYAGMFHRKKATPGRFMMRLRIPNGLSIRPIRNIN
jgi:ferredoxin-nitrite reductase